MNKPEVKLFIPKVEHNPQTLCTALTKPEAKKTVALFSNSTITDYVTEELIREDNYELIETLFDAFHEVDKEDLFGRLFSKDEMGDGILNENEQRNFLNLLKEKSEKLFETVSRYIETLKSKSDEEKIAHNIALKTKDNFQWYNKQLLEYSLADLNNENLMSIAKEYNGFSILYELYCDAQSRADSKIPDENLAGDEINERLEMYFDEGEERTEEKIKEKTEKIINEYNALRQYLIDTKNSGLKDLETIKNKSLDYVNYLIQLARKNNIYVEDYKQALESIIEKNDIKNLTIVAIRLNDRMFMLKDKEDKTVNASKRAIPLKEANGEIDEVFVQGYTGDCWFLSALNAMCTNKEVLHMVNSMISLNKENNEIKSITVKIQDKEYTIPYENIKSANEYSTGDLDVRALEMAVNQYIHEKDILRGDITLGGWNKDAYEILFGKNNIDVAEYNVQDEYGDDKFDSELYLNALKENKDNKILSAVGIYEYNSLSDEEKNLFAEDKDGNKVELPFQHAYTYSRIDDEFFYFTNPHAPEKELRIPLERFEKVFDCGTTVTFKDNKEIAMLIN